MARAAKVHERLEGFKTGLKLAIEDTSRSERDRDNARYVFDAVEKAQHALAQAGFADEGTKSGYLMQAERTLHYYHSLEGLLDPSLTAELQAAYKPLLEASLEFSDEMSRHYLPPTAEAHGGEMRRLPAHAEVGKVEERIREATIEHAVPLGLDGAPLFEKTGNEHEIRFTQAEVQRLQGTVFTHNHPNSFGLSDADVSMAAAAQMLEMRAVGRTGAVYRFQAEKWPPRTEMDELFQAADTRIKLRFEGAIETGEMTIDEANARHGHEVMRDLVAADKGAFGFRYAYTPPKKGGASATRRAA